VQTRCSILIVPASRSTCFHCSPRTSEMRALVAMHISMMSRLGSSSPGENARCLPKGKILRSYLWRSSPALPGLQESACLPPTIRGLRHSGKSGS
jgi:hypothetical protein